MSLRECDVDDFIERLSDMPDVEAIQEIDLRLVRMDERRLSMPLDADGNREREALNLSESLIRAARHTVVMRMDRMKWSKAVRAIWGQEGLEQALVWMEVNGLPSVDQVARRRDRV